MISARALLTGCMLASAAAAAGRASFPIVRATGFFSEKSDTVIADKMHSIVIGVSNEGERAVNLTMVMAWLEHPQDPSMRVWNFSAQAVGEALEAGRETAVEYKLYVPRFPEPVTEWRLVAAVYHADLASRASRWAASPAFNSSIVFTTEPQPFDAAAYLPYALATAVLAVTAVVFRGLTEVRTFKSGGSVAAAAASGKDDDEPSLNIVPEQSPRRRVKA